MDESGFRPGNGVYLNSNGELIVCKGQGGASNAIIHAGGGGEKIEIRDWDNNLLWTYTLNDDFQRLHHDIAVMPNGNIIAIAWERILEAEAISNGRDPALISDGHVWPEKIIEIDPSTSNIVWEWHAMDHLIQDFDITKDNFGIVADHPELINFNYANSGIIRIGCMPIPLITMPTLTKSLLDVPTFNEIWILDHSTTTQQAAGHSGGFSGRGGDLMYRFGNIAAYDQGIADDQVLFYPHDAHWVDKELNSNHPDYNKIMIFNNQIGADFSEVNMIDAEF